MMSEDEEQETDAWWNMWDMRGDAEGEAGSD